MSESRESILRKLLSPSRNVVPRGAVGDCRQQNRNEPNPIEQWRGILEVSGKGWNGWPAWSKAKQKPMRSARGLGRPLSEISLKTERGLSVVGWEYSKTLPKLPTHIRKCFLTNHFKILSNYNPLSSAWLDRRNIKKWFKEWITWINRKIILWS